MLRVDHGSPLRGPTIARARTAYLTEVAHARSLAEWRSITCSRAAGHRWDAQCARTSQRTRTRASQCARTSQRTHAAHSYGDIGLSGRGTYNARSINDRRRLSIACSRAARHGWQWRPPSSWLGARCRRWLQARSRRRLSNACSRAARLSRQWRPRNAWLGASSRRRLSFACSRAARLSRQWRPRSASHSVLFVHTASSTSQYGGVLKDMRQHT